jgi:ribonuclease VapC
MFLDASAIIAILARESDAAALAARLGQAVKVYYSPIVAYETILGLARIGNIPFAAATEIFEQFVREVGAQLVPIGGELGKAAIRAFDSFGKGRHAAGLNMGDCFAYACADSLEVPLLFKGNDFPLTDISAA